MIFLEEQAVSLSHAVISEREMTVYFKVSGGRKLRVWGGAISAHHHWLRLHEMTIGLIPCHHGAMRTRQCLQRTLPQSYLFFVTCLLKPGKTQTNGGVHHD